MTSYGLQYVVFSVHYSYTLANLANAIEAFGLELPAVHIKLERQQDEMIKVTIDKKESTNV